MQQAFFNVYLTGIPTLKEVKCCPAVVFVLFQMTAEWGWAAVALPSLWAVCWKTSTGTLSSSNASTSRLTSQWTPIHSTFKPQVKDTPWTSTMRWETNNYLVNTLKMTDIKEDRKNYDGWRKFENPHYFSVCLHLKRTTLCYTWSLNLKWRTHHQLNMSKSPLLACTAAVWCFWSSAEAFLCLRKLIVSVHWVMVTFIYILYIRLHL